MTKSSEAELSFKDFKEFLNENCFDEKYYGDGKYDRKIFNWFKKTIHQREKEVRKEVIDTVMGIDARFNSSPSDVRNNIIKAIKSLEVEDE